MARGQREVTSLEGAGLGGKLQSRASLTSEGAPPGAPHSPHSGPASCSANSQGWRSFEVAGSVRCFAKVR